MLGNLGQLNLIDFPKYAWGNDKFAIMLTKVSMAWLVDSSEFGINPLQILDSVFYSVWLHQYYVLVHIFLLSTMCCIGCYLEGE